MNESPVQSEDTSGEVVDLDIRTLLTRHVKGEQDAFPQLMQKFRRQVYSYLIRCGVPDEARDDLFQEIFIKVHHAAPTYQPDRPLEPWLFTVVANSTRSYFRKQMVQRRLHDMLETDVSRETITAEDMAEVEETAEWLEQQIISLPPRQREVIALCCFDDLSRKDVAQILNCPIGTVKTHLRRARASLAKALADRDTELGGEVSL